MLVLESSLVPSLSCGSVAVSAGSEPCTVVWFAGEHDLSTADAVRSALDHAILIDEANVVADLSGVSFIDAGTIGALVGTRQRLAATGRSLEFRAPSKCVRRLLQLCELS